VCSSDLTHRDLDLAIDADDVDAAIAALGGLGYGVVLDARPVRIVAAGPAGRSVDIHPVRFDATGRGRQANDAGPAFDYSPDGFTAGSIAGVMVPCLSADQLVCFHVGYEPKDSDRHDMALLRDRLGVVLPPPYRQRP